MQNTLITAAIDIVRGDEWAGLYLNGECVLQSQTLDPLRVLEKLGLAFNVHPASNDWLDEVRSLPQRFTDVTLAGVRPDKDRTVELAKCAEDPAYFVEHYVKILSHEEGLVPFQLWPFQKEYLYACRDNRFVLGNFSRQSGKKSASAAFLLHAILFQPNTAACIISNKLRSASHILDLLKRMFITLPKWMQIGVRAWSSRQVELANGSTVHVGYYSDNVLRGMSFSVVYLHEFAFVKEAVATEFWVTLLPLVYATHVKLLIPSTPNGKNHFYHLWEKSRNGENEFVRLSADWNCVPWRDESWKEKMINQMGEDEFGRAYECSFEVSSLAL